MCERVSLLALDDNLNVVKIANKLHIKLKSSDLVTKIWREEGQRHEIKK